ncbi:ATP-binding protein [Chryseobacterium sp. HSC-36S06]|uniref:ATP-binding protein n=1 Tax=Chryseobacterium sp. HSC-36S06 TaxID=2910970 RepID=UPI00209E1205|nr:ATP-binding protein [Chryseobacterium sp. HSC-36S06]MCP2037333.1 hypothetical protein [Chryseobacterium sp. HSC-36S06]
MKLRQSQRKKAKIKMALQAPSGAGKTMSALLIAKGLCNGDLSRVAIIDTENGSADLYAHLGNYNVVSLRPPFTPDQYIQAIGVCEEAGMEVIIIDSISHCWDYLLDYHSSLAGNSFTNWSKIKPLEKALIDKILQCGAHVISTMRTKQDYVLNQKDGKFIPEKVGLKAIQRDGMDYEFTLVLDIDIKHFCVASKDRTGLFMDKPQFLITSETGTKILEWCNQEFSYGGSGPGESKGAHLDQLIQRINDCQSITALRELYRCFPEHRDLLQEHFESKKNQLIKVNNQNQYSLNGKSNL